MDRISKAIVQWWLPWWWPAIDLRLQLRAMSYPLLVSIHAPQVISIDAEVWTSIWDENLIRLQELFEARAASIYDVSELGTTLLFVSGLTVVALL